METKFNFKSQPCTSREQSERLLSLGLKKETADMCWIEERGWNDEKREIFCTGNYFVRPIDYVWDDNYINHIPAWSLHRMWELICNRKKYESKEGDEYPKIYLNDDCVIVENPKSIWARHNFCSLRGVYENVINCIEWLIKEGYFNKEYLEDKK